MIMYKLIEETNPVWKAIKRLEDGAVIPMNPDNTDYQAYLAWLELGNFPLPADEVTL
jgi:hypothetical protein